MLRIPNTRGWVNAGRFALEKATRLKHQLERLLAQDLSEMGHQARIRHQQRIEELAALCTPMLDSDPTITPGGPPHLSPRPSDPSQGG